MAISSRVGGCADGLVGVSTGSETEVAREARPVAETACSAGMGAGSSHAFASFLCRWVTEVALERGARAGSEGALLVGALAGATEAPSLEIVGSLSAILFLAIDCITCNSSDVFSCSETHFIAEMSLNDIRVWA